MGRGLIYLRKENWQELEQGGVALKQLTELFFELLVWDVVVVVFKHDLDVGVIHFVRRFVFDFLIEATHDVVFNFRLKILTNM
jgi:hypothetical protein